MALIDLLDPGRQIVEGAPLCDRVNEDDSCCALVIRLGDGFEALLACRVPDLHFDVESVDREDFDFEVYADGGDVVGFEVIVDEAEEDVGFSDCSVSDDDQFDHVVVAIVCAFGMHWGDSFSWFYPDDYNRSH